MHVGRDLTPAPSLKLFSMALVTGPWRISLVHRARTVLKLLGLD